MAEELLKPEYFVTRTDGKMVPLIAVDELPHHIVIGGVKRVMSPFDIVGMTSVGRSGPRHRYHDVLEASELAAGHRVADRMALKARYFLTRDSGNMVSLVAMDEMPEYFVIDGVPREVSPFEIAGMTCAGISPVRERLHVVEDVNMLPLSYAAGRPATDREADEKSNTLSTPDPSVMEEVSPVEGPTAPFVIPSRRITISTPPTPEVEDSPAANLSPSVVFERPQPSQHAPSQVSSHASGQAQFIPGKKTLCSFWLRRGECDYSQQGCMFLHEMPRDRETLNNVGLRDIPRWYRDKHGLGSFLATGGSGAGFGDEELRSAAALGVQDSNKEVRLPAHMASNWRDVPRQQYPAPPPAYNPRGNTYNPHASRMATPRGGYSNPFSAQPPMISGPLRSNETMETRDQLNTLHQMDIHARAERYRQQRAENRRGAASGARGFNGSTARGGQNAAHSRRFSVSTLASDIEAAAVREDSERRTREDEEYARDNLDEGREQAAAGTTAPIESSVGQRTAAKGGAARSGASRGGARGSGRGGKAQKGRRNRGSSAGGSKDAA